MPTPQSQLGAAGDSSCSKATSRPEASFSVPGAAIELSALEQPRLGTNHPTRPPDIASPLAVSSEHHPDRRHQRRAGGNRRPADAPGKEEQRPEQAPEWQRSARAAGRSARARERGAQTAVWTASSSRARGGGVGRHRLHTLTSKPLSTSDGAPSAHSARAEPWRMPRKNECDGLACAARTWCLAPSGTRRAGERR